jgi:hypothetical protein
LPNTALGWNHWIRGFSRHRDLNGGITGLCALLQSQAIQKGSMFSSLLQHWCSLTGLAVLQRDRPVTTPHLAAPLWRQVGSCSIGSFYVLNGDHVLRLRRVGWKQPSLGNRE